MDFELTKEQKAIQKAAREFAEGEFNRDVALEHELAHTFPFDIWRRACQLGLVGMYYPEEYGGQGYGLLETLLVIEELCRRDSGLGTCMFICEFGSGVILRFGSNEQKRCLLPAVARGEAISAAAFTEPDHGSDITSLGTLAVKDGDEYVIEGTKTFITNGGLAEFAVVLCQTDTEVRPAHRGQSLILVELDRPGVERTEVGEKMSLRMSSTAELCFRDVRVPVTNLVGGENQGFYHTLEFFDESRLAIAAQAVGIAQGAFDRALDYAKHRKQFGQRLADFQAIQHKLAEMAMKIETARLLTYKSAWTHDNRPMDPKLTSMAKLHAARVAVEVCEEAIQIFGGYGLLLENEVERFYRDARVTEIYEGTREIHKNIIARALVGRAGQS
ncbi:MAG: acyl-CoA dehydrogenase family protein [Chloroflexi bacterium]|nr:acyl-CoA dehydrogenase family protein [Chloroflexota bacterium]